LCVLQVADLISTNSVFGPVKKAQLLVVYSSFALHLFNTVCFLSHRWVVVAVYHLIVFFLLLMHVCVCTDLHSLGRLLAESVSLAVLLP
jgi:hypothetical protein